GSSAGVIEQHVLGTLSWGGSPASAGTLWDLASVTKPIVGLAVMALVEAGALSLEDSIGAHLPAYRDTDKAELTVADLLTHTSGIPGQQPLYRRHATRAELLAALIELRTVRPPGVAVEYSSQGFMLLGLIAEHAGGLALDRLVARCVTDPAGMNETQFCLTERDRQRAAATEDCPWRDRVVQGTVHDENAEVLGGVAGHAGLFGTVGDLARLGGTLCRGGGPVLADRTLAVMIEPRTDALNLRRTLGWQGRDRTGCSGGDLLTAAAYGHTGFTGTSIWVDPGLDLFLVLLTNRVHPSRAPGGITRIRRRFHNAAVTRGLR
ncbi:MAG TPA: serine hydrolase domain-containing protein, partial [Mycobacteriales bacterium]|nr:serine hydrolase domain-containing protein [Mycobacteriales bacterium]